MSYLHLSNARTGGKGSDVQSGIDVLQSQVSLQVRDENDSGLISIALFYRAFWEILSSALRQHKQRGHHFWLKRWGLANRSEFWVIVGIVLITTQTVWSFLLPFWINSGSCSLVPLWSLFICAGPTPRWRCWGRCARGIPWKPAMDGNGSTDPHNLPGGHLYLWPWAGYCCVWHHHRYQWRRRFPVLELGSVGRGTEPVGHKGR